MISFEAARRIIFKSLPLSQKIDLPISKMAGSVLAEDVFARCDCPELDKSTMDGFAVRSMDVRSEKVVLRIIDNIRAGSVAQKNVRKGEAVKIATGAMIPKGSDCVVMKEDARLMDGFKVLILKSIAAGENIYKEGKDFKKGERLLKKGAVLNMARAALLSSQGYRKASVYRIPKVSILSTGSEIVEPGVKKNRGKIWNASSAMLLYRLGQMNIRANYLGISPDNPGILASKIKNGLKSDILIITGAVSEGDCDIVPNVLRKVGAKVLIHKVLVKPGKPFLFAVKSGCFIFGLPGNPVSSMVSFLLFVEPAIKKLSGLDAKLLLEEGVLSKQAYNNSNRLYFHPMKLAREKGRNVVEPLLSNGSADLLCMSKADGFLILNKSQKFAKKGSVVKFLKVF